MNAQAARRYKAGPYDYSLAWILLTFLGVFGIEILSHVIAVGPKRLERVATWEEIVELSRKTEVLLGCVDRPRPIVVPRSIPRCSLRRAATVRLSLLVRENSGCSQRIPKSPWS